MESRPERRDNEKRYNDLRIVYPLREDIEHEYFLMRGKLLGSGNFGSVYKVKNLKTDEFVAIKILKIEMDDFVNYKELAVYEREAYFLMKARHSNIVEYIESFRDDYN